MNPYEMPSHTTVSDCLKHWGTNNFEAEFFSELAENESDLPLEAMCLSGGYPSLKDRPEFDKLEIDDESQKVISGSFCVSFTEESPTGCRDIQWKDRRSAQIDFSLNLYTGEVEFEPPLLEREYEPEEF